MKNTKIKKRRNTKKYSKNLRGSAQPTQPSKPKSINPFNRKKSYKKYNTIEKLRTTMLNKTLEEIGIQIDRNSRDMRRKDINRSDYFLSLENDKNEYTIEEINVILDDTILQIIYWEKYQQHNDISSERISSEDVIKHLTEQYELIIIDLERKLQEKLIE